MTLENGDRGQLSPQTINHSADITQIDPDGDLILDISHQSDQVLHKASFRASTARLTSASKYFDKLLSDRFGEGQMLRSTSDRLRQRYGDLQKAPLDELPAIRVEHVGRISNVKSITGLLTDFLSILHDVDRQAIPPAVNLANLAIVADRFDALEAVGQYLKRKKIVEAVERRTTSKHEASLSEEKIRQRLLVGMLFDHASWVEKYSLRLIVRGYAEAVDVADSLWWELPGNMEEEIAFRRECVLQTVQALQMSFIQLYTSRARQCRLGYDSSGQCDSFQLGEMMRFFLRIGTLRVMGTLYVAGESEAAYTGDLNALIDQLRQVPEYQIDSNHSHCGIRTRLIPALSLIAGAMSYVGVCGDCWRASQIDHSWAMAKRPLVWARSRHVSIGSAGSHERRHELVRSLFLAEDKLWD